MKLSSTQTKFILHWGEMGTRWGINRSIAQIHALLYISEAPLHAEEISETLGIARSNVSTGIKELQGWGLVKVVQQLGDRRDYFETYDDVWEMFDIILEERIRREVEPTVTLLRECIEECGGAGKKDAHLRKRLQALDAFFADALRWYSQLRALPIAVLRRGMSMGGKLFALAGKA